VLLNALGGFPVSFLRLMPIAPGIVGTGMSDRIDAGMAEYKGLKPGKAWQEQVDNIPLERSQTPEDVANPVSHLASEDSNYMAGQAINNDDGIEVLRFSNFYRVSTVLLGIL